MPTRTRTLLFISIAAIILIAGIGGFFAGFEVGFSKGSNNHASEIQQELGLVDNSSSPIFSNPFTYNFDIRVNSDTAYVPMIYMPAGYTSSVYVQYDCIDVCESDFFPTIASFNITSYAPLVYQIEGNGSMMQSPNIEFNGSAILLENNDSETVIYSLTNQGNDSGYYSFVFPYTCEMQPVLYIGSHARDVDFNLVRNWLEQRDGVSQVCPQVELDVNLMGFTNTDYSRLTVNFATNTSTSTTAYASQA